MINLLFFTKKNNFIFSSKFEAFEKKIYIKFSSRFNDFKIKMKDIYMIYSNKFILDNCQINLLKKIIIYYVYVFCFCWSACFELLGYNFDIQKKLKKNSVRFNIGFSNYRINLFFSRDILVTGYKRNLTFFSSNIRHFFILYNFLLELRHLFPYKKRGLIPSVVSKTWLKPGKKVRNQ